MSLTSCLKKAGAALHADDRAAILKRSAVLRRGGMGVDDAARQAVDEQLGVVRGLMAGGAIQAPALPNPWEISQDEFVRLASFTKEGSTAFPWVAKWGDRILEAQNEEYDHPDLGKTVVMGGRFSKTKREAEAVARGAHKRAVRRAALNGNTPTLEALSAYADLRPADEKKASEPAEATVGSRPTAPISDAGEKIGGARKDQWAARGLSVSDLDAMTESEGATHAKKASVWSPDYAGIAKDADPVVAAMVKVVYDSLAAKPKENTPEGRRDYVRAMQAVRKVYGSVKTVDEAKEAYRKLRAEIGIASDSYRFATTPEDKAAYRALFSVYKGRSDPFVFDYTMAQRAKSLVNDGFPGEVAPWKRRIAIRAAGGAGLTTRGVELAVQEAEALGTSLTPDQARAGYFEARLLSTRKTVAIAATREGAEAAAAAHYESMKSTQDGGEAPDRPHLDRVVREGLPERRDHDVTSQDFIDTFGWRGIEFGNWAAQDERQRLLNLAYDSLHDLAQVLNVPPQALSLNGQMGLAFGARGGGKFAAHYEPGRLVINMTKLRGAGSLAHEWAHALDHYLGELDQPNAYTVNARGASGWYSQARYNGQPQPRMVKDAAGKWVNKTAMRLENLRPELAQKIDAVMKRLYETPIPPEQAISMEQAEIARLKGYIAGERAPRIKQTYAESLARHEQILADLQAGKPSERTTRSSYAGEAQKLSGKSIDGYWVRPTEMFARAFESYVFDRVTEMGARSDYLVHGVESDRYADSERYKGNPYPVGQERQDINRALGDFVSELKTRETDKGVAIFSRKADPERQALRWTSTDSNTAGPEFYSPGASLIAIQQLNTQDDFADDALPLGHNAQVAEGNTAHRFLIVDPDGGVMGEAALEVNPAGEVEAIHDIEITDKRQGAGRQAVAAILANTAGPVRIIDILDQSDAFWQKMGAGYKDTYGNATADWSSYRQARNNARGIQGQGPRSGEGLEAGRPAEGQPGSRQEGEVGPKANRLAELLRGSSGKGLPVRLAEIYAGQYEAAGLHRVNVARNFDDLPASLRAKLSGYGDDVRGAYFPSTDQIYVFTDNLATPDELHFVVMHEAFHRGVGALFGDQGRRLMRQMYATNQRLRERADSVSSELKISRDEAIEEALADMAGEGDVTDLRGWARLSKLIKDWLAKVGEAVGINRAFSDKEIETFVAAMARAGVNRDPEAQGRAEGFEPAPKASRAVALPDWVKQGSAELQEAAGKVDTFRPQATFKDKVDGFRDGWKKRLVQGMFDAYAPLKELDYDAYVAARMAKSGDGVLEGMLMHGKPRMDASGAITGDLDGKGFLGSMQELQGEHDRFFLWLAGNRSKRLKVEGRENLFSDAEISAMSQLNSGVMPDGSSRADAYRKASNVLSSYNKSVLDVAEQSGIIDGESRATWEHDFYVPFFRLSDDGTTAAPGRVKGLVRQKGIEKLKGGKEPLGDLMENTLRNWSQLINASLANQAARKSLQAAEQAGVALEATEDATREMAKSLGKKGSAVYYMDDGRQRWYIVDDPFVLDAISSMEAVQMNGLPMKIMGAFKKWLTFGVTVSPAFKVRNLIRDSVAAIAQSNLDFRVDRNLAQGWKATDKESADYAQMLFGGGLMRFGTQLEGDRAAHVKRLIEDGVKADTILDTPEKVKSAALKAWDAYKDFGDRLENVNRAALYKQRIEAGMSSQQAAYEARDLMDFSLHGSFTAVRFLTQVVPFLNARLQGLYKLGRSAGENPKRFGYVAGAVALASIALMLAYRDDDDWKRREDFDRDNFWWFKVGSTAYRIPKPFELGAIGTIAERSLELLVSEEMDGHRYAQRLRQMVSDTFAMNPVPQFFKPMLDLYANKDSFTGREIETQGMERHSKAERYGPSTTGLAILIGKAGDYTNLSPAQVDQLLRGYFGWLGTFVPQLADAVRPNSGRPEERAADWSGGFIKALPAGQSRYATRFWEEAKSLEQFSADLKRARDIGDFEKARELVEENRDKVGLVKMYRHAQEQMERISKQVRFVRESKALTPQEKRDRLDQLSEARNKLAEAIETRRLRMTQ